MTKMNMCWMGGLKITRGEEALIACGVRRESRRTWINENKHISKEHKLVLVHDLKICTSNGNDHTI